VEDPFGWLGAELDGRVSIEEVVGEGGYGIVYRGRHLGFDEAVAVKCLKVPRELTESEQETFARSFQLEARMLHKLSRRSASIVQALDVGTARSPKGFFTPFIVMEWLDGKNLRQELRAGSPAFPVSVRDRIKLLMTALDALAIAHAEGVAHLDLKPANLFVVWHDDCPSLKVLDFGVARLFSGQGTKSRTLTQGDRPLTPHYAAPEQFDKVHGAVGPRSDVFALGLILFEMLTGQRGLIGDSALHLYLSAANERVRPTFARADVRVSRGLEEALQGALAVSPSERFADARTLADALRAIPETDSPNRLAESTSTPPPREVGRPTEITARRSGQNRVCTVLIVEVLWNLTNTTADEAQVSAWLDTARSALRDAATGLGGALDSLSAETSVVVFGMRHDDGYAAPRAMRAALQMREAIAGMVLQAGARLELRCGAQTGRIFVGGDSVSTDILGAPVKAATRYLSWAGAGDIVIGQDCYRHVAGLFEVEPFTPDRAKAVDSGERIYRVLRPASQRRDLEEAALSEFYGVRTRFVGRELELGTLIRLADGALDHGRPQLALIRGERGLGKTRLLSELEHHLVKAGFVVVPVAAHPLREKVGYGTIASILRHYLHIHEDDPCDVARIKLRRVLRTPRAGAPSLVRRHKTATAGSEEHTELILRLLGLHALAAGEDNLTEGDAMRHRVAAAVVHALSATQAPLALLLDDVHWADGASLDLLDDLARRMPDQPLLVVASSQPAAEAPPWASLQQIHLDRPPERSMKAMLLDRVQRVRDFPDELADRIVERAEGSPLILVAMLQLLIDTGAILHTREETWLYEGDSETGLHLPTTVQQLVQARLDRLQPGARSILGQAAVVGTTFWGGCLETIGTDSTRSDNELAHALATLMEGRFIQEVAGSRFPGEREFRFVERVTRDVAYEMLALSAQRQLHHTTAGWLRARTTSLAEGALVAYHFEQAGNASEALQWYRDAGEHALRLGHNDDAHYCLERANDLATHLATERDAASSSGGGDGEWTVRVDLGLRLGDVLRRMGRVDEAQKHYESCAALVASDAQHRHVWLARVAYRRAQLAQTRGQVEQPIALLEAALASAEEAGIREERALMLALLASLERRAGNGANSWKTCREGLRVCRTRGPRGGTWREAVSRLLQTLGTLAYRDRNYVRAARLYRQSGSFLFDEREPHLAARAANNVAAVCFAMGDLAAARDAFERALSLAERSGDARMTVVALNNLGEVSSSLGDHDEAGPLLEEAAELGERMGAIEELADVYRNLMLHRLREGAPQAALDAAVRAVDRCASEGGRAYQQAVLQALEQHASALEALSDLGPLQSALERLERFGVADAGRVRALFD